MSRYFFDTEFIESGPHKPIELISIGIVTKDDEIDKLKTYYAVSSEFDPNDANDWVRENVLNKLNVTKKDIKRLDQIKKDIIKFVGNDPKPQFWANHAAYDWVVFCQIFGTMMDLPENFPTYVYDLRVLEDELGRPKCPEQKGAQHNALDDAIYNMKCYEFLKNYKFTQNKFNLKEFRKLMNDK